MKKTRLKLLFNIFVVLSFIFLAIYLYKFDYLSLPLKEINWFCFGISVALLFAGYVLSTLSWWFALKLHNINISVRQAISSHGLAIFGKYIPGKVWTILGRAARISLGNSDVKQASYISLKEQLVYVWVGLLISVVPLLIFKGITYYTGSLIAILVALTFVIGSKSIHNVSVKILKRIIKKDLDLPILGLKEYSLLSLSCLVYWGVWIAAFYFLSISLFSGAPFQSGLAFPLSIVLGLMAIIIPGGFGVRESVMVSYLVLFDIPMEVATGISVLARLWFILGELFIFLLGFLLRKINP